MREFVNAALAGDTSAWDYLFRQHYPWMYATALHLCGNNASAKDAVQETFVNAYLKLHQLKDTDAFAAWLKTSLRRHCFRSQHDDVIHTCVDLSAIESQLLWEDEINRKLDWYERQTRLYHILSSLPDILQSVLLLRHFSNFSSYEQMAVVLGIPVGTVRSRLNQAKQRLMKHWQQSTADNDKAFRLAQEWNSMYNTCFGNLYTSLQCREKLITHFDKNLRFVLTSGKTFSGRKIVERKIEEDLLYGNSFADLQVMSSGNISIVEAHNTNAPEYPNRCPDNTVFVLHRTGDKTTMLRLHHST